MANETNSVASESKLEKVLLRTCCEPVLKMIPESVHPNSISLVNHLVCWAVALAAIMSFYVEGTYARTFLLVMAGVGMFVNMMLDNLDGMQARRTNRCSKLGELLDHWLDAVNVPLVTAGMTVAMGLPPWVLVCAHIGSGMVYHSQLVLFHHTGKFIAPPSGGSVTQVQSALAYIAIGVFLFIFPPQTHWVQVTFMTIGILAILLELKESSFYYVRLKGLIVHHLFYVAICAGVGALHLIGAMDTMAFLLVIIFVSFRISGSYVLFTLVQRRYNGFDLGAVAFIGLIAYTYYFVAPYALTPNLTLQACLPYLMCLYLLSRNLMDFLRFLPEIRPAERRDLRTL